MDPLSIAASVITLNEAVRRIVRLAAKIRNHSKFIKELNHLVTNVELLSHALDAASSALSSMPPQSALRLLPIICESRSILQQIESLVKESQDDVQRNRNLSVRARIQGIKRASRVQKLNEQLSQVLFGILFFFTVCERPVFLDTRLLENGIQAALETTLRPSSTSLLEVQDSLLNCNSPRRAGFTLMQFSNDQTDSGNTILQKQSAKSLSTTVQASRSCQTSCNCSCHHERLGTVRLAYGALGYVFFSSQGNIFQFRRCSSPSCAKHLASTFLLVYQGPRWLSNASFAFRITDYGRISVSLSFPRIIPPDHRFCQAIRDGDCKHMQELLATGQASPVDIVLPQGLTVIDLAMFYSQWEASELLISQGATQFVPPKNHWSIQDVWDYFRQCSLISTNVSVFTVTSDGLNMTSPESHIATLRIYMDLGRSESLGFSQVHKSVTGMSSEHLDNIDGLRGKADEVDSFGRTGLYWAATLGHQDALGKLLLNGASPDLADFNGSTPLHRAASTGSVSAIALLVSSGADLEARDRQGFSPLVYACSQGHINAIDSLLEHGADINSTSSLGESCIHIGSHAHRLEVVQFLTEHGASLKLLDDWGFNSLLDAIFQDAHDIIRYILTQDCPRDTCLYNGQNIFHIAALNSNLQTIEILLDVELEGVDPYALDDAGFAPLEYLRQRLDAEELLEPFCALILKADKNREGLSYCTELGEEEFFDAEEN